MKYAIQCNCFMWDNEKEEEYAEWLYLALEGEKRLFVFEDQVTDRTKLFDTAAEAGAYVDKHFGGNEQRCSYDSVRIVEV